MQKRSNPLIYILISLWHKMTQVNRHTHTYAHTHKATILVIGNSPVPGVPTVPDRLLRKPHIWRNIRNMSTFDIQLAAQVVGFLVTIVGPAVYLLRRG